MSDAYGKDRRMTWEALAEKLEVRVGEGFTPGSWDRPTRHQLRYECSTVWAVMQ